MLEITLLGVSAELLRYFLFDCVCAAFCFPVLSLKHNQRSEISPANCCCSVKYKQVAGRSYSAVSSSVKRDLFTFLNRDSASLSLVAGLHLPSSCSLDFSLNIKLSAVLSAMPSEDTFATSIFNFSKTSQRRLYDAEQFTGVLLCD